MIAAFAAADDTEIVMVASDGQVLRTPAAGVSAQGAGASGVAGMKLKAGANIVAAGNVRFRDCRGRCHRRGLDEGHRRGRGTDEGQGHRWSAGTAVQRFLKTTVAYGWIGKNRQIAAIIVDPSDIRKTEPTPVSLILEPTRRDGPAVDLGVRIAVVGEHRL